MNGQGNEGCYGVDELCVGDELKGCVCMLVWEQVMVSGSRGGWTLGNLALGSVELKWCRFTP